MLKQSLSFEFGQCVKLTGCGATLIILYNEMCLKQQFSLRTVDLFKSPKYQLDNLSLRKALWLNDVISIVNILSLL